MSVSRVLLQKPPFSSEAGEAYTSRGLWPAQWVWHPVAQTPPDSPVVVAYKCAFSSENASRFRLHLTADERYDLFLDGEFIGRGSERSDGQNWFFESYGFDLAAGTHLLG